MNDQDLTAMLKGMAHQMEGEAREVRANNEEHAPGWATSTLTGHAENLDSDATVLRTAAERIDQLNDAVRSLQSQCDAKY